MRRYRFLVCVTVFCLSAFFVAAFSSLGQKANRYTGQFNSLVLDFSTRVTAKRSTP